MSLSTLTVSPVIAQVFLFLLMAEEDSTSGSSNEAGIVNSSEICSYCIIPCTVNSVLTHGSQWTLQGMGYHRFMGFN
ncbi:hypothetical protein B0H10DRAFT_1988780 [Mycena sp. CBHHK59/15]|nr:hypothetical protein B0H10DRAFT_1988780 [Mycena sp. CBHHK59/15]